MPALAWTRRISRSTSRPPGMRSKPISLVVVPLRPRLVTLAKVIVAGSLSV